MNEADRPPVLKGSMPWTFRWQQGLREMRQSSSSLYQRGSSSWKEGRKQVRPVLFASSCSSSFFASSSPLPPHRWLHFRLADPARALSRMKESFDTIMKQKESIASSSSQPSTPALIPPAFSPSSARTNPTPHPSSTTASSFYSSIASLPTSSRIQTQLPQQPRPAPPFNDFGPSSTSSSSLAQLFAVRRADEDRKSKPTDLRHSRQDPIDLGYITEAESRSLFAL